MITPGAKGTVAISSMKVRKFVLVKRPEYL